jgi:ATP/maltotriose-dependent transcriptional regulator MalT
VRRKSGDLDGAMRLSRRALRMLGETEPFRATVYHNMAAIHAWEGEYAMAAHLLQRAIELREKASGAGDEAELASHRRDLGRVLERMRQARRGVAAFR